MLLLLIWQQAELQESMETDDSKKRGNEEDDGCGNTDAAAKRARESPAPQQSE